MDSLKNKQVIKNRQEEIKKATALMVQGGGLSAIPPYTSKKRKYPFEFQSLEKSATSPSTRLEPREVFADAPRHGVGKGLMTSQGHPFFSSFIGEGQGVCSGHCLFHHSGYWFGRVLRPWDRPFGWLQSLWHDEGMLLNHCLVLFYFHSSLIGPFWITFVPFCQGLVRMQALQICCASWEVSIKCLKNYLKIEVDILKQFKESIRTLS